MAGRSEDKLEKLRLELADTDPGCMAVPIIVADLSDPKSLDKMTKQADVILSVAGPFHQLGMPLVRCPTYLTPARCHDSVPDAPSEFDGHAINT